MAKKKLLHGLIQWMNWLALFDPIMKGPQPKNRLGLNTKYFEEDAWWLKLGLMRNISCIVYVYDMN